MKIFLHASSRHFNALPLGEQVIRQIVDMAEGEPIAVSARCFDRLKNRLPSSAFPVEANSPIEAALAISIGGDGTFLRTAHWAAPHDVPILGINAGHLGYLADFSPEDFLNKNLDAFVEERMMLRVETDADLPDDIVPFAVNEIALLRKDTASMISVSARLNEHELTTYRGDGLIVSTPTGSTGYNMSVGGPIIEPTAPVMVISPVAPHALTMRPLVVNATSRIILTADSRADGCLLSFDSRIVHIPVKSRVIITKARFPLRVAQRNNYNFTSTLRTKLLWGRS